MYYTELEKKTMWEEDQVAYAERAHCFMCCDIPTLTICGQCRLVSPEDCRNKKDIELFIKGEIVRRT